VEAGDRYLIGSLHARTLGVLRKPQAATAV
jgi:hypothetical protein